VVNAEMGILFYISWMHLNILLFYVISQW